MPKCVNSLALMVSAVFVATVAAPNYTPARADNACIEQPNQPAPEGARWSARYDRAKGRKCWFLTEAPANGHDVATQQEQPSEAPEQTLSSRLSSLFDSLTGASTNVAPQGNTPQSNAANAPRKPRGDSAIVARAENGVRADQRNVSEAQAAKRVPSGLTQAERNALFADFLRWHENQSNTGR